MSHPYEGIAVLAPASDLTGPGLDALGLDAPAGGWVFCDGLDSAREAARGGAAGDRIVVQVGPGEVAAAVRAGWRALVDVDGADGDVDGDGTDGDGTDGDGTDEGRGSDGDGGDARIAAARAGAIAAVCAWQGARIIRTRHLTEVRRCLDMTESILGTRPPAWTVRGLG
jgi:hypothetical protein